MGWARWVHLTHQSQCALSNAKWDLLLKDTFAGDQSVDF